MRLFVCARVSTHPQSLEIQINASRKQGMIMVTVKYFLSEEGKIYFKNWLKKVHSESLKQEGFISLDSQCDATGNPVVSLQFANENLLTAWSITSQHNELVNDIAKYCIKPVDVESKLFV